MTTDASEKQDDDRRDRVGQEVNKLKGRKRRGGGAEGQLLLRCEGRGGRLVGRPTLSGWGGDTWSTVLLQLRQR